MNIKTMNDLWVNENGIFKSYIFNTVEQIYSIHIWRHKFELFGRLNMLSLSYKIMHSSAKVLFWKCCFKKFYGFSKQHILCEATIFNKFNYYYLMHVWILRHWKFCYLLKVALSWKYLICTNCIILHIL